MLLTLVMGKDVILTIFSEYMNKFKLKKNNNKACPRLWREKNDPRAFSQPQN